MRGRLWARPRPAQHATMFAQHRFGSPPAQHALCASLHAASMADAQGDRSELVARHDRNGCGRADQLGSLSGRRVLRLLLCCCLVPCSSSEQLCWRAGWARRPQQHNSIGSCVCSLKSVVHAPTAAATNQAGSPKHSSVWSSCLMPHTQPDHLLTASWEYTAPPATSSGTAELLTSLPTPSCPTLLLPAEEASGGEGREERAAGWNVQLRTANCRPRAHAR